MGDAATSDHYIVPANRRQRSSRVALIDASPTQNVGEHGRKAASARVRVRTGVTITVFGTSFNLKSLAHFLSSPILLLLPLLGHSCRTPRPRRRLTVRSRTHPKRSGNQRIHHELGIISEGNRPEGIRGRRSSSSKILYWPLP